LKLSSTSDIGRAGERHVVDWLKAEGYSIIRWNTQTSGSTEIEAKSSSKRLLVQVRTAVSPTDPVQLTPEEEKAITSRAARIGAQAWEARIQVGRNLDLVGNVRWRKI
jgi:Holliday junction resolvase